MKNLSELNHHSKAIAREEINDLNDVKKHVLGIHSTSLMKVLNGDMVMGVLEPKEKTFIMNNIEAAFEALNRVDDPKTAEYCANRLLLKAVSVAILNRNVKGNPMIMAVLEKITSTDDEPDRTLDENIKNKIKKKKENNRENDD